MHKYYTQRLLIFMVFHFTLEVLGQNVTVKGKIVNKESLKAIPFAHIIIENTQIGVISDLYGDFKLTYPERYEDAILEISCLGYKPLKVPLRKLNRGVQKIRLEEHIIALGGVVVKPENPVELLKEAFSRIYANYDTTANILSGYYKMSALLDKKNIRYTEAFIDIFKLPYQADVNKGKSGGDSIRLRQVRVKANEIEDWKLHTMLPWEKSIYHLGNRDIIREFTSEKNTFEKFVRNYEFELEKMVIINGRSTYMIRVKPKTNKKKSYWNGQIFLDEQTKAFVKIDFVSKEKVFKQLKRTISFIIASKLYKVNYDEGEWKESVNFQLIGDKWYFKEVNASKHFLISSKKRNMEKVPVHVNLYYNTDTVTNIVAFPDTVAFFNLNEAWWVEEKYFSNKYNPAFWNAFDRQKGIESDDIFLVRDDSLTQPKEVYTFTRLDTLQGALTPLRTCFDVGFYHLDVEVSPADEIIKGSSLIRFNVVDPTKRIQIDLFSGMSVDSIIYLGKKLDFEREYNAVYVDFPETLQKDVVADIKVYFSGQPVNFNPEIPLYASFIWAEDEKSNPWLQAICQGYGASGWWPNKDHLSDEPDSAVISITVPSELEVVANGRLRNKTLLEKGRTRFDWFVSYPINNYNITLNAGKYMHFEDNYIRANDTLNLGYYVLSYNLENARKKVDMVKPMLATYERFFGAYPFSRDGFKLVETPHAMEHQSCVALGYEYFSKSDDQDTETSEPDFSRGEIDIQVVLHETAHEWWGNAISCTDNAELWIHEAFATYAEALYIEDHYGYENSQVYLNAMKKWVKNEVPIIGRFNVNHIHYDISDMYYKGALMLNTLRHTINDDPLWFSLLKGIQAKFKYQVVTTKDIIEFINQKTATDYTPFFDQYLRNKGIPQLELTFERKKGKTHLRYRWVTDVKDFKMRVEYTSGKDMKQFLLPTKNWKTLALSNSEKEHFKVNTNQFLIETIIKN